MRTKILGWLIKGIIAVVSFAVLFFAFQLLLTPKYVGESTTMVDGLKQIEEKNLDILFLGSSQMFCSVDAKMLKENYGINAYDFGASNQSFTTTVYYLEESLKYCKPKAIFLEIGNLYFSNSEVDDASLAWNYAPTDMSIEKYRSLYAVTNNFWESIEYAFFPLFLYHGRWNEDIKSTITYYRNYHSKNTYINRGFTERQEVSSYELEFFKNNNTTVSIPDENKEAIKKIVDICHDNGVEVVFFKVPVPFWTKNHSETAKDFMSSCNIHYIDFYDHLEAIDLDENMDFRDDHHVNVFGARKITMFIGDHYTEDGLIV